MGSTVVGSSMRKTAGAGIVVLALLLAGCGDGASVSSGGPTTTEPAGSDDVVHGTALGSGSWGGARTTPDGDLLITFTGGPPYETGDPCTIAYDVRSEEDDAEVRVTFRARSPKPSGGPFGCEDLGYGREVVVELERPFGDRRLVEVQFDREQPVFDGSTLREPTALPEGWELLSEGPGYPDPETATSWSRTWGPPAPEPSDDRCTPAPAPVTLTQGPPAIVEQPAPNGERVVATHDVAGAEATYAESAVANTRRLTWVADGVGFVLTSGDRCAGDPPTTPELLLEIARSLG